MNASVDAGVASVRTPDVAAKEVLDLYWDGVLPVNPGAIAQALGAKLVACTGKYEFSGHFINDESGPTIEYNLAEPVVRRRFTVAHELGHMVLGHGSRPRDLPVDVGVYSASDPEEIFANQFAAELLMPSDVVKKLVMSGKMRSVEELADAFMVSKVAMGYRLSNLRLRLG